ncbi:MAG: hypothetical protein FWH12_02155 [Treponema sp.]|nr:hypothetical protein [Treponema sp.]
MIDYRAEIRERIAEVDANPEVWEIMELFLDDPGGDVDAYTLEDLAEVFDGNHEKAQKIIDMAYQWLIEVDRANAQYEKYLDAQMEKVYDYLDTLKKEAVEA